jgi:hypothetical protein
MGGVDGVAGFDGKVDMDERIGSVGWSCPKESHRLAPAMRAKARKRCGMF